MTQDVGVSQRFSGLGNELQQTGHIFSVGLYHQIGFAP